MVSQLWAVLYQHPAWLLMLPRPKCRLTWPTVLLLLVMLLDMDGNMPVVPHFPPTTVTFPRRWHSRECRQPEKVVTPSQLLHSDGKFCLHSFTRAHLNTPTPSPPISNLTLLPSLFSAWRAGFTDSPPLCWWHLNISCHNFSFTENLTWC